jgi:Putative addiction module component
VGLGFTEIVDEALRLPKEKQLELARTLLERNEASGDLRVEAEWEDVIERRIRQIDSGLANGWPFAEVLRDVDRRLGR